MDTQAYILKRITQLRLKLDVSEKQMSRELGKSPSYLSSLIASKSLPSLRVLIDICDYFEISLKEYFDEQEENPMLKHKIIDLIYECSDEEKELVYNLLKSILNLKSPRM